MPRFRRTGSIEPDQYGGWKRSSVEAYAEQVRGLLEAEPHLTLGKLRGRLGTEGAEISMAALNRFLAAEQERMDVGQARTAWRERQPAMSPERLVFIDETWAATNMARRHGRARRGQRVVSAVPHSRWKTTTFLAALRHDRITAPSVFDGAINGERFLACIEQALAPTLRPGDVVILDNLGAHKVKGMREAIEARGATLLDLPPYSPDLNPIEQVFAKRKALLRTAKTPTVAALWHAIGQALDAFSPTECANYLTHADYVPSDREPL